MNVLEPPNASIVATADLSSASLNKGIRLLSSFAKYLLLIIAISIVFLSSVGADLLVLQLLNLAFGNVIGQNSLAQTILMLIRSYSGFVTAISYALTIVLLIIIYLRDFLRISLGNNKKESESLTTKAKQLLRDTLYTILVIATLTLFFIALIIVIALVLEVTTLMFGSLLLDAIKIFTALAIAIAYVLTIALSLVKYGRDLVKVFQET